MSDATQAGILLIGLMLTAWLVRTWMSRGAKATAKTSVNRSKEGLAHAKTFLVWANPDMIISGSITFFCFYIWIKFNINGGNVEAIKYVIELVNKNSQGGGIVPDPFLLKVVAAMPSIFQLWLLQFNPEGSNRELVAYGIMALDILATAFGFWVGTGLVLNVWLWKWLEFGLALAYLIGAFVVNYFVELVGHDCGTRFYMTILGKTPKGIVTA